MLYSMTGFARAQSQGDWGGAICELRSINHRYLEISVYLPEMLQVLEGAVRDCLKQQIKRGKVECKIRYQPSEVLQTDMVVHTALVKQLAQASEVVSEFCMNLAPASTIDILRWPGVLKTTEMDTADIQVEMVALIEKAVQDLLAARAREGQELKELFLQRVHAMQLEVAKVKQRAPDVIRAQREQLLQRFVDAQVTLDANRLEQEMVLFAQKIDVMEELERLETHLREIQRVLKQGGVVGRRLDFLMQELNREANTLGSKAVVTDAIHAAVELKVLIEQMREQVQNIE
ncbi:MAG: YicC family protein [Gammaproteobacteria bacterium RIFCSPHIGHO2_12_FULL_41_20]|nr:MAG: YicC family protein [Gammaproteobacteria bacterium RIFCSPHIGHO2_12_FULL_41_20]